MILHWPQITMLVLLVLGLGISMEQHGRPKTGTHSFWSQLFAAAITFTLLYFGGFFG